MTWKLFEKSSQFHTNDKEEEKNNEKKVSLIRVEQLNVCLIVVILSVLLHTTPWRGSDFWL